MSDDPYADFKKPDSNFKVMLRSLADELERANEEVVRIQTELTTAENMVKDIVERKIPEATEGMDGKFDLGDGRELELNEKVRASIAGDKRVPAIKWLDEHDFGHIVKRQLIFEFGKGSDEEMKAFVEHVKKFKKLPVMKENFSVHPQTLIAWVNERLKEGDDLPKETFGIFVQRFAKIKGEAGE